MCPSQARSWISNAIWWGLLCSSVRGEMWLFVLLVTSLILLSLFKLSFHGTLLICNDFNYVLIHIINISQILTFLVMFICYKLYIKLFLTIQSARLSLSHIHDTVELLNFNSSRIMDNVSNTIGETHFLQVYNIWLHWSKTLDWIRLL